MAGVSKIRVVLRPDSDGVQRRRADWFVRLERNGRLIGGGVLVGDGTWILTAGHCAVSKPDLARLRAYSRADLLGPADEVISWRIHPGYDQEEPSLPGRSLPHGNDLALLRIETPGPTLPLATEPPEEGVEGLIFGWGKTLVDGQAHEAVRLNRSGAAVTITASASKSFWASPAAASGDSGGPFVADGQVLGVYSGNGTVMEETSHDDCYTATAPYLRWIRSVVGSGGLGSASADQRQESPFEPGKVEIRSTGGQ